MSCSYSYSLPSDVPWRRICVTKRSLDKEPHDGTLPDRWKPTIAVYRYDPEEEYQPYEKKKIAYLKIGLTLTPWQPEVNIEETNYQKLIETEFSEAYPTYGALLHVSVFPKNLADDDVDLAHFPHIIAVEPESRQLYESVTETGEVLAASASSMGFTKSGSNTKSTQVTEGWKEKGSIGIAVPISGVTVGASEETEQSAELTTLDVDSSGTEESTTSSAERRETESHTTQLSQMYNLLQTFHIGSNRVMFFHEPEPHVRQAESTFINGARALEGMQDHVLVVVYDEERIEDFCVNTLLELAHVSTELDQEHIVTDTWNPGTPSGDPNDHPVSYDFEWIAADHGWEEYEIVYAQANVKLQTGPKTELFDFDYNDSKIWATAKVQRKVGEFKANFGVWMQKKGGESSSTDVTTLFLSAWQLKCCAEDDSPVFDGDLSFETTLPEGVYMPKGMASRKAFKDSRTFAATVREQMLKSGTEKLRYAPGDVGFQDSDAFRDWVVGQLKAERQVDSITDAAGQSDLLADSDRQLVDGKVEDATVEDVLRTDTAELARVLEVSQPEVREMKGRILGKLAEKPQGKKVLGHTKRRRKRGAHRQ